MTCKNAAYTCQSCGPNPQPYAGPRDPIDPKAEGMVRLYRCAMVNGTRTYDTCELLESIEVVDSNQRHMAVGRVAARYDANSSLTVLHDGKQWTVETWREKALGWEAAYGGH